MKTCLPSVCVCFAVAEQCWPPTKQHLCISCLAFRVLGALAAAISPGITFGIPGKPASKTPCEVMELSIIHTTSQSRFIPHVFPECVSLLMWLIRSESTCCTPTMALDTQHNISFLSTILQGGCCYNHEQQRLGGS